MFINIELPPDTEIYIANPLLELCYYESLRLQLRDFPTRIEI